MKLIKQIIISLLLCVLLIAEVNFPARIVSAQTAAPQISKTKKTMYVNDTYTLKITGTEQKIVWKSSNKEIATVSKKGTVTAKKVGTCTITAIIGSGEKSEKLKCKITVRSRLSCDSTLIRCYADEYEIIRINVKKMSESEELHLIYNNDRIVSVAWDNESEYHDIIIVPDELGITNLQVELAKIVGYDMLGYPIYAAQEKDALTLTVISYPDRNSWIKESDIENYGFTFIKSSALLFYDNGYSSLTGAGNTPFRLDPKTDEKAEKNTYINNGIVYKIKNKNYYFSVKSLEDLFLSGAEGKD